MARKPRIEKVGFYHIINRGVARVNIYLCDEDFLKFLEILQEASQEYDFEIYSFALMTNHYHLLIEMKKLNLSSALQKINSRYSIYFNNKYKRVGPLWQGRFKSWYVYDTTYLSTLVRYIEFNPIKANITKQIGEYKWSMSSLQVEFFSQRVQSTRMLNLELIKSTSFEKGLDEKELEKINELYHSKVDMQGGNVITQELKDLNFYFANYAKERAIFHALRDGYTQKEIAAYLNLSHVSISKIGRIYKDKIRLFNKLKDKGIFWSYSKEIQYEDLQEDIVIEYLLKYGDFDDIKFGFELFGKRVIKKVWEVKLKSDRSFIKTNLMIARVFLDMDVESDYFKGVKNARFEKLKLLAS